MGRAAGIHHATGTDAFAVLGTGRGSGRPLPASQMTDAQLKDRAVLLAAICSYELDHLLWLLSRHGTASVMAPARNCHHTLATYSVWPSTVRDMKERSELERAVGRMEKGLRDSAQQMDALISSEPLSSTPGPLHDELLSAALRMGRVARGAGAETYPGPAAEEIAGLREF